MLPPLFPSESPKLDMDLAHTKPIASPSTVTRSVQPTRTFAALHSGFWVIGTLVLTVFGVVSFLAIGIVTSSPSTASVGRGTIGNNSDLGNVYGTWTDLPQNLPANQSVVFDAQALQSKLAVITARYEDHEFGVVVAPVGEGDQVRLQDSRVFTGASTTKLLTAAAILARVDSGKLKLDQTAYNLETAPAKTEGEEQSTEPTTEPTPTPSLTPTPTPTPEPKPVTVQQALQQMVNRSNNTAWEQLIKLVGSKSLRQFAADVGMQDYEVTNNRVSPRDMALLLQKIYTGQLLSESSTKLLLSYMQHTNEERMIPAAITNGGEVYHKYGWINSVVHDVGVVDNFGNPVIVVLMSEGKSNYSERTQILRELADAVEQAIVASRD